jgi:hypothetical protein
MHLQSIHILYPSVLSDLIHSNRVKDLVTSYIDSDCSPEIDWAMLVEIFSERFRRDVSDKITAGPLFVNGKKASSVMIHGHKEGLFISRRPVPWFRGRLWISWSLIVSVKILSTQYSKKYPEHTDAILRFRTDMPFEMILPWHRKIDALIPESTLVIH